MFPVRGSAAVFGHAGGRSVLFGGVLMAVGAVPAAGQFAVQPVIMELRAGGTGVERTFTVRNESDERLQLRIYASDYDQPESGGHVFMEAGTHERSCADRLAFFPGDLVLDGRASGEVRVRMSPGDSTCWSLVFVQSVARAATGIRVAQRIGVKVYGVVTDAVAEGELREVRVEEGEDGRVVELAFANIGAAPLRPEGEIEVRTEAGDVIAVVPVPPFSVLPGRVMRTEVPLAVDLRPGSYLLVPVLDFGGDYLAGGQALLRIGGP